MTTWNELAASHKPRPITRFQRILNGERDHMAGYDDGEWPNGDRPADFYSNEPYKSGIPEIDNMSEVELAFALNKLGIW